MALTEQQGKRIEEIAKREDEIRQQAETSLNCKVALLAVSSIPLVVGPFGLPAVVTAGVVDVTTIKSWQTEVEGYIREIDQLQKERSAILGQTSPPLVEITTGTVVFEVESTGTTLPEMTIVGDPGKGTPGKPTVTVPGMTISVPSSDGSSTPTITIPTVEILVNEGGGSRAIELPEIRLDDSPEPESIPDRVPEVVTDPVTDPGSEVVTDPEPEP